MRYLALPILTLALLAAGCTALGMGPQAAPSNAPELARLVYPKDAKYGDDLDVVVIRRGEGIQLINRTPKVYKNIQLWLNQQWVLPVAKVDIGELADNRLSMGKFVNQHAEPYPLGGLLTPDRDMPLVLAEIYDPAEGLRHHLLVRNP